MKRHQILLLHIATSILVLFPFPIHAHKMMYQDSIEIVVHRGANHIAPENTIPSALAALKHGAGWIEVDVRKSKDNILYNLHDETLDRTTNGKGPIQDMLSKDIERRRQLVQFSIYRHSRTPYSRNARYPTRKGTHFF